MAAICFSRSSISCSNSSRLFSNADKVIGLVVGDSVVVGVSGVVSRDVVAVGVSVLVDVSFAISNVVTVCAVAADCSAVAVV